MRKIQFPLEKVPNTNSVKYPDNRTLFSNTVIEGTKVVANYTGSLPLEAYIEYTTNIQVVNDKVMIGTPTEFIFNTNLPDGIHYMPVRQQGTERMKLFLVNVLNGGGILTVSFNESGIYYIDREDLTTDLTINNSKETRFTLYVAE